MIHGHLPEYNENAPNIYYKESENKYNLKSYKVDQLHIKSCLFLGIPIKCFDTDKTWGVLMLDSTKKDERFDEAFARKIEEIIGHYIVFFMEGS